MCYNVIGHRSCLHLQLMIRSDINKKHPLLVTCRRHDTMEKRCIYKLHEYTNLHKYTHLPMYTVCTSVGNIHKSRASVHFRSITPVT